MAGCHLFLIRLYANCRKTRDASIRYLLFFRDQLESFSLYLFITLHYYNVFLYIIIIILLLITFIYHIIILFIRTVTED